MHTRHLFSVGAALLPLLLSGSADSRRADLERRAYAAEALLADCSVPTFLSPDHYIDISDYAVRGSRRVYLPLETGVTQIRPVDWLFNEQPDYPLFYMDKDSSTYAVGMNEDAQGCTKIMVKIAKNPMTIAIRGNQQSMRWEYFTNLGIRQINAPAINVPSTPAGTSDVTVMVYRDGKPVPTATPVVMQALPIGNWKGRMRTVAHEHIYNTIRRTGNPLSVTPSITFENHRLGLNLATDDHGVVTFKINAGYRSGTESVLVTAANMKAAAPVSLSIAGGLIYFPEVMGAPAGQSARPSTAYPILLTGAEGALVNVHRFNHWISPRIEVRIKSAMTGIWQGDAARRQLAGGNRWLQVNDMSVEGGGMFKVGDSNFARGHCNYPPGGMWGDPDGYSHIEHQAGLDMDLSPCYTAANGSKVGASGCVAAREGRSRANQGIVITAGNVKQILIDEKVLFDNIVGMNFGVIFVHGNASWGANNDGAPYHYHVRFRPQ